MKGITALLFLLQATAVNTGSHTIWTFATFIYGQTQFPEFSVVVMLDDLQVLYYERNMKKLIFRSQPSSKNVPDFILEGANIVMEDIYNYMRSPAHRVNILSNHTGGVHVHQGLGRCVLDDDKPSLVMVWESYDGVEVTHYDMHVCTVNPRWPQLMWTTKKEESYLMDYTNVYKPICIQTLKYYLEKEKNIVFRKVPEEGSDVAVLSSLVVVLVLVLVFTIPAFVIYKRRRRVSSTSFLRVDPAS